MVSKQRPSELDLQAELARLKRELKRAQQEQDILKEAVGVLCQRVKEHYPLIKSRSRHYPVRMLCEALGLHPSGYYAWLKWPTSLRKQQDKHLIPTTKQFWLESGGHYGYHNIHVDLREVRIDCGRDRVLRLMIYLDKKSISNCVTTPACVGQSRN